MDVSGLFVVCSILPSGFNQFTDFFFFQLLDLTILNLHLQKLAKILSGIPFALHAVSLI